MLALLHGNRVVDVAETAYPVAKPLRWIECEPDVRPDFFVWDGERIVAKPAVQVPQDDIVMARLREIDAASIRALREWVAKQPDAPQIIKDREAEAQAEREKLK